MILCARIAPSAAALLAALLLATSGCAYGTAHCVEARWTGAAVPADLSTLHSAAPKTGPVAPVPAPPPADFPTRPGAAGTATPSAENTPPPRLLPDRPATPEQPAPLDPFSRRAPLADPLVRPASAEAPRSDDVWRRTGAPRRIDAPVVSEAQPVAAPPVAFAGPDSPNVPGDRFRIPEALPGSDAPAVQVPPFDPNQPAQQRRADVAKAYAPLPPRPVPPALSSTAPLSLAEVQQLAVEHSPLLRQAAAQVETARGKAIQAGAPPNPTLGYESDTVRQADTPGMQGGYATQTFITAGKLTLAAAAAHVEFHNAQLALRRARIELATSVRRGYADVLVARERVRFALALADLAEEIYRAQIDRVAVGESAPYEPLQLRVLAVQARNEAVRAVNAESAAWRSLASAVGMPEWTPVPLAGAADRIFPAVSSAAAAAWLEARHTDLAIARNGIAKSRRLLDLARVTPIPDIDVYTAIQKDNTTPPYNITYNLQVGLPIPLFNRNRGNIVAAEADVVHAVQEPDRVRNTLLAQLAAALAEYDSARELAARYRGDVLRNQVQTYRGVHARFHVDREKSDFSELVISQQTLATALREYVEVLREQWDAAIRLAALLQVDDLSELEHLTDGPAAPSGPAPVPAPAPEEVEGRGPNS